MSSIPPFSWQETPRPIVALAPMAGVTDASYRRLLKRIAPEIIVFSEFLSTDALAYRGKKTLEMLEFDPGSERPFIVQVFGKDPRRFLEAARIVEQAGADGIDINMGCPAARVVSSCHGSALMRNPALACELVAAVKNAVRIPVSVKTRLGWDTAETLLPFCERLIAAGADALAIHGRTFQQKFSGAADFEPIYALKRQVSVPVIGNGDIFTAADAVAKLGNLDGVMMGRGTIGNPWVMREICEALRQRQRVILRSPAGRPSRRPSLRLGSPQGDTAGRLEGDTLVSRTMTFAEKIPLILEHCALAVSVKGERKGMLEMRRHLVQYVRGMEGAKELRARLVRVETSEEVSAILAPYAATS